MDSSNFLLAGVPWGPFVLHSRSASSFRSISYSLNDSFTYHKYAISISCVACLFCVIPQFHPWTRLVSPHSMIFPRSALVASLLFGASIVDAAAVPLSSSSPTTLAHSNPTTSKHATSTSHTSSHSAPHTSSKKSSTTKSDATTHTTPKKSSTSHTTSVRKSSSSSVSVHAEHPTTKPRTSSKTTLKKNTKSSSKTSTKSTSKKSTKTTVHSSSKTSSHTTVKSTSHTTVKIKACHKTSTTKQISGGKVARATSKASKTSNPCSTSSTKSIAKTSTVSASDFGLVQKGTADIYSSNGTLSFNANSRSNVAVYYGSTSASSNTTLGAQCSDANVDMVILSFIRVIDGPGGYPNISFGSFCSGPNSAMTAANATGLSSCPDLANNITYCQNLGKKVFVSIGGANGNTSFASSSAANSSATVLWNTFGGGNTNSTLRPFGSVVVDGFDIDNESGDGSYYTNFAAYLRKYIKTYKSTKAMYLSAAPGCYWPYAPTPLAMLTAMDFVWPQFYDSPSCGLNASDINSTIKAWGSRLYAGNKPRFMIGALSFEDNGGGGYESPDAFNKTLIQFEQLGLKNFGGVTLWDGANAHTNLNSAGADYVNVTKSVLLK